MASSKQVVNMIELLMIMEDPDDNRDGCYSGHSTEAIPCLQHIQLTVTMVATYVGAGNCRPVI